jgi:hypothetical protein
MIFAKVSDTIGIAFVSNGRYCNVSNTILYIEPRFSELHAKKEVMGRL